MTGVGFEKRAHSRARGRLWDDENLETFLSLRRQQKYLLHADSLCVFANLHVAIRDFPKPNPNLTLPLEEMMKKSVLPLVCAMMFSFAALAQDKPNPLNSLSTFETIAIPRTSMRRLDMECVTAILRPEQSLSPVS